MKSVLLFTLLLCGFGLEVNARATSYSDDICAAFRHGEFRELGLCYRFVNQEKTWYEAEKACNGFGGNLASIQRKDRYDFIINMIYSETGSYTSTWVGGHKEGDWFWSDGSLFTFSSWSPGEPNNAGGNENCMEFNLGGREYVNDANCDIKLPFVCSKRSLWDYFP